MERVLEKKGVLMSYIARREALLLRCSIHIMSYFTLSCDTNTMRKPSRRRIRQSPLLILHAIRIIAMTLVLILPIAADIVGGLGVCEAATVAFRSLGGGSAFEGLGLFRIASDVVRVVF